MTLTLRKEETHLASDETLVPGAVYLAVGRQIVWSDLKGSVYSEGVLCVGDMVFCISDPQKHPSGESLWVKAITRIGVGYITARNANGHYEHAFSSK